MGARTFQIKQEAQTALLDFFKQSYPERARCYFENAGLLLQLYDNFQLEVTNNCIALSDRKRDLFMISVESAFEKLAFKFDAEVLDKLFRQYGVDKNRLLEINDPELRAILCMDPTQIWMADRQGEEINKIVSNKDIQREFLQLFFHMKRKKIFVFLSQSIPEKKKTSRKGSKGKDMDLSFDPRKKGASNLLLLLENDLVYLADSSTGLKSRVQLASEKRELITRIRSLKDQTLVELNDLLFLPRDQAMDYLRLFSKELERSRERLEKYEYDLLQFQDPAFVQAGLELQLRDREDISEALKAINAERLKCLNCVLEKVNLRLLDYQEIDMERRSGKKKPYTALDVAAFLIENDFLNGPRLKDQSVFAAGMIVENFVGLSAQNLREAMGEVKKAKPSPAAKRAIERAKKTYDEALGE